MAYDRYRDENQDGQREYGRDYTYSSARDYEAAGRMGGDRDEGYGRRDYGYQRYGQRERMNRGQSYGGGYGYQDRGYDRGFDERGSDYYAGGEPYRGTRAHDGRRWTEVEGDRDYDRTRDYDRNRDYGRDDRGQGRGFFARAEDEVRSWFGGDRDRDDRGGYAREGRTVRGQWQGDRVHDHRDRDYHEWRQGQIAALDRDYDEYRRENRDRFHTEFSSWRQGRQGQRDLLNQVEEHMEVLGSDGQHVGTVDKVRGDRIILTKNDQDAGGHHHSIPSSWLRSVDGGKVQLAKSSVEAKTMWRDEERNSAMFGGDRDGRTANDATENRGEGAHILDRSFSGTYENR